MQSRRRAIAAILATAAIAFAAPSKPNFTGRWRLDPSQSSKDSPAELTENVDHRESTIRIDTDWNKNIRTGVSNAAILAPAVQLNTDGSESSNPVPVGLSVVTKSHWDGDKLVTEWRLDGLNTPMNGTWTRYLTGPNVMVVDGTTEGGNQKMKVRFVFVK